MLRYLKPLFFEVVLKAGNDLVSLQKNEKCWSGYEKRLYSFPHEVVSYYPRHYRPCFGLDSLLFMCDGSRYGQGSAILGTGTRKRCTLTLFGLSRFRSEAINKYSKLHAFIFKTANSGRQRNRVGIVIVPIPRVTKRELSPWR